MAVTFKDNSQAVIAAMKQAQKQALTAIGEAAVEVTVDYMNSRYGSPIYQTGDLQRDVNYRVQVGEKTVTIGNSLEYAVWVHNGTRSKSARPYLRDAITENADIWREIAEEYISDEMK